MREKEVKVEKDQEKDLDQNKELKRAKALKEAMTIGRKRAQSPIKRLWTSLNR